MGWPNRGNRGQTTFYERPSGFTIMHLCSKRLTARLTAAEDAIAKRIAEAFRSGAVRSSRQASCTLKFLLDLVEFQYIMRA